MYIRVDHNTDTSTNSSRLTVSMGERQDLHPNGRGQHGCDVPSITRFGLGLDRIRTAAHQNGLASLLEGIGVGLVQRRLPDCCVDDRGHTGIGQQRSKSNARYELLGKVVRVHVAVVSLGLAQSEDLDHFIVGYDSCDWREESKQARMDG